MRRAGQPSWCWPSGARGGRVRVPSLFELNRREIPQRRVQPAPVVDFIDETGKPFGYIGEGPIVTQIDFPALEGLHETFRFGVGFGRQMRRNGALNRERSE